MSHLAAAGGCRRVDRLRGRLDEFAGRVLDAGKAHAGAGGKIQLGIADRAGRVSQLGHQVLRTLEGLAYRPFWRFAAAGRGRKFRTDFCKIVREDVIGALAVSAVEDVNRKFGEFHFWIEFLDGRIVPGFDFPEKNIPDYGPREFELALHIGQFEDHYNSDQHSRQFENWFLRGEELCFGDGRISAAEIAGTGKDVAGALRGSRGHVANIGRGLLLVIRLDPALIERLRHAGAGGPPARFFPGPRQWQKEKSSIQEKQQETCAISIARKPLFDSSVLRPIQGYGI